MGYVPAAIEGSTDTNEIDDIVRDLRTAWKDKDYEKTRVLSNRLLAWEPENTLALIYLSRSAARFEDWAETAALGHALVGSSPRDAFNAARALNRAGLTREAARIYTDLHFSEDWFDSGVADVAWKEGIALLKKGDEAMAAGDTGVAKLALVAGARLAPSSRILISRLRGLADAARQVASQTDRETDLEGYIAVWREVLWLEPRDIAAATKVALAIGRGDDKPAALEAWLTVLGIDANNEKAIERIRALAARNDLEDGAVRGLSRLGRDETDPFVRELTAAYETKAHETGAATLKAEVKECVRFARSVDRETQPRRYLDAWKAVLALDPTHVDAAKKMASVARRLGDQSELLDGLVAIYEADPHDQDNIERLASAGLRAQREQTALDHLARHDHADLAAPRIASLHKRIYKQCKNALSAGDFDLALSLFRTLASVDPDHHWLEPLRPSLVRRAASGAKVAEKAGNIAIAVALAEQVLQIAADQPVALAIVGRDLLRHKAFSDVIALCLPKIQPGVEYDSLRKLVEKATAKLPA